MKAIGTPSLATGVFRSTLLERVVYGQLFTQAVADDVLASGTKRVLIIASPHAKGSAALARLRVALGDSFAGEFCEVQPHVSLDGACAGATLSIAGGAAGVKTGASHALGHVIGAHTRVAHGLTSCALLAAVLRWNASHNGSQPSRLMSTLGVSGVDLGAWVEELVMSLGLPTQLRAVGVARDDLPAIAKKSLQDPGMRYNPRPVESAVDALEILEAAW